MTVKSNIKDGVGYSGNVVIRMSNSKSRRVLELKNNGKKALWNMLAKAVLGIDVSSRIPRYLDMISSSGTSLLFRRIPFTGSVYHDTDGKKDYSTSTVFVAALTSENKKISSGEVGDVTMRMVNSANEVLAEINGSSALGSIYKNVVPGVDAIIEWEMMFMNNSNDNNEQ